MQFAEFSLLLGSRMVKLAPVSKATPKYRTIPVPVPLRRRIPSYPPTDWFWHPTVVCARRWAEYQLAGQHTPADIEEFLQKLAFIRPCMCWHQTNC